MKPVVPEFHLFQFSKTILEDVQYVGLWLYKVVGCWFCAGGFWDRSWGDDPSFLG